MLGGDRLALARLITHVENRTSAVPAIMKAVHGRTGGGYIGYGQINTDVPLENAEAMLSAFARLTYPTTGKATGR